MSVYSELMNEAPTAPTGPMNAPRDTGAMSQGRLLRFRQGARNVAPEEAAAQSRMSAQRKPMTGAEKTEMRRKWKGPYMSKLSRGAFERPGTKFALAAGTKYKGNSLLEDLEYIKSFLESKKEKENDDEPSEEEKLEIAKRTAKIRKENQARKKASDPAPDPSPATRRKVSTEEKPESRYRPEQNVLDLPQGEKKGIDFGKERQRKKDK